MRTVAFAVAAFAAAVVASDSDDPCGILSSSILSIMDENPEADLVLPAETAYNCLAAVPMMDPQADYELIEELKVFLEWNSHTEWLRNPPETWVNPPVDLISSLNNLEHRVLFDVDYDSEYAFQLDLNMLFVRAYDFHLVWTSDIQSVFLFEREFVPVSVSMNGSEFPQIYSLIDIVDPVDYTPSPVVKINGQNATEYIANFAVKTSAYIEDHARFNNMMWPTGQDEAVPNPFSKGIYYYGPTTTIEYANGTEQTIDNMARLSSAYSQVDWSAISSVEDFYDQICASQPGLDTDTPAKRDVSTLEPRSLLGYPEPLVNDSSGILGGFFLEEEGYESTAVLSLSSFSATNPVDYQQSLSDFLDLCRQQNKDRMVIDLRGNGGGSIVLGYESFKQFFPNVEHYGAANSRANEAMDIIGNVISSLTANATIANDTQIDNARGFDSQFNFRNWLTIDDGNFSSWDDFYGPHMTHGDVYTSAFRYNLSQPVEEQELNITGFGSQGVSLIRPFAHNNIVILQDGQCGSTCSIFTELMRTQGNVRSISVGGEPRAGPMQGVSGTKGANVLDTTSIQSFAAIPFQFAPDEATADYYDSTALGALFNGTQLPLRAGAGGSFPFRINFRNALRQGDESGTPTHFIYDAADCRFWYTPEMIQDVRNVWVGAAHNMWHGGACIDGSTNHPSSTTGHRNSSSADLGLQNNALTDDEEDCIGSFCDAAPMSAKAPVGLAALAALSVWILAL
ncbi:hypothetical protein BDY21DRAFT_301633 [Lineolata rhizophorae]|uniref:Uncharacterized protein n=1 Tax=Lineolata rhizophorae TaxID=578093 RepID=A0A6A6P4B1_9PEZI|nr:hypothetical protein BDY21DRAFT_301633 [Lineolata rhizophorae]